MPRLLYASSSPYSSMAGADAGIARLISCRSRPKRSRPISWSPIRLQIPVPACCHCPLIHDSRAITQHLNRMSRTRCLHRGSASRPKCWRRSAHCDGALQLVGHQDMPETPTSPGSTCSGRRGAPRVPMSRRKWPKKITAGQIALRACLGYLALRFALEISRCATRWAARFDEKFLKPQLAFRCDDDAGLRVLDGTDWRKPGMTSDLPCKVGIEVAPLAY